MNHATFTARQKQSETSKAFYRSRAEAKRARRAARWNQLAAKGAIGTVTKSEPVTETAPAKVRKPRAKKVIGAVVD